MMLCPRRTVPILPMLIGFLFFISSAGHAGLLFKQLSTSMTYIYDNRINPMDMDTSFIVTKELLSQSKTTNNCRLKPLFLSSGRTFTVRLEIEEGTSLYGTGEVAGHLLRNGTIVRAWNSDAYSYTRDTKSLYQSFPWVLAVRKDGTAYGLLADTTRSCEIDLRSGIRFAVNGKAFPVIVIEGTSPQDVVIKLSGLIGRTPLPPLWSLGYQQCRFSYESESVVTNIASTFRRKHIPCDVIWMDIDYMDGFRIFTFDKKAFPDPKRVNDFLHANKFKSIWMIDPGVKIDPGYSVYDEGTRIGVWVHDVNGKIFNGNVWPGPCVFPDFTVPKVQFWWAGLYKDFLSLGVDGVWNDMNEPAVFNGPGSTMPLDNKHQGGGSIPPGTHEQYHNVYGMLMVKSTRDGILAVHPDKRPFVLSRANYIGGNKFAACWTGDNVADWEHLEDSISMSLNLGLSGQPFSGPDIGGYAGNGDEDLFSKWISVGALLPFSRGHTAKGNRQKEPWAFSLGTEDISRVALQRRYRLLPYIYTIFHEASTSGLPVMRPLFFSDPADPQLRSEDKVYTIGDSLLVIPHISEKKGLLHLPKGIWAPLTLIDEKKEDGQKQPELRVKGGTIIPAGKIIESSEDLSLDPLTLYISPDQDGKAEGTLYEDAGNGFGYLEGDYLLTTYSAILKDGKMNLRITKEEGKRVRPKRETVVIILSPKDGTIQGRGDEKKGIVFDCNLPLPVPTSTVTVVTEMGFGYESIPSELIKSKINGKENPCFVGEYFNNKEWSGLPALVQTNHFIAFNWKLGAPYPVINSNDFSVRWKADLKPVVSGSYRFKLSSDDGSRLLIDNKVVIDNGGAHAVKTEYGDIVLEAGKFYKIVVEFVQYGGESSCDLTWRVPRKSGN